MTEFKYSLTGFQKLIITTVIIFGLIIISFSYYSFAILSPKASVNGVILDIAELGTLIILLLLTLLLLFKRNIKINELQSYVKIVESDKALSEQKYRYLFMNNPQVMWQTLR